MTKIFSWNVNGIRAVLKKDALLPFIKTEQPDILCLQELKAKSDQFELDLPGYEQIWYSADKPGYSGTAILSKQKPLLTVNGFPQDIIKKYGVSGDTFGDPNLEGRVIAAEYAKFWLVTVYTPNAKDNLSRLELRHKHWDPAFLAYCQGLESGKYGYVGSPASGSDVSGVQGSDEARTEPYSGYGEGALEPVTPQSATSSSLLRGSAGKQGTAVRERGKPVIFCGDLNVAHTEDDLANPKPNRGKKGFTDEERAGFQAFVDAGFVDTLRLFKQGNGYYTWWSHFANARARNVGWRIDYFLVSSSLKDKVRAAAIHPAVMGSDHCPVSVTLDI